MNHGTKVEILLRADQRRTGISDEKGAEYAGQADAYKDEDADVLANFKRQSKRWDISTIHVIGTYFGKHIDSIETFVREVTKPGLTWEEKVEIVEKGEGIVSRLDDARNYLDLFECLLYEERLHPEYLTKERRPPGVEVPTPSRESCCDDPGIGGRCDGKGFC